MTSHILFFSLNQFKSLVSWSRQVLLLPSSSKLGDMSSNPAGCLTFALPLCHCAWHWARQGTDTRVLYCWTLYINCFFFGFRQWQYRADRVLTLIMNIWLPLPVFWSPWSRTKALTLPHEWAWHMGVIIAIVEPQRKSYAWSLFFLELSKILENKGPLWGFFNPHPPDWRDVQKYQFVMTLKVFKQPDLESICW